jgi:Cu2+-exporting ATPase
MPLAISGLLQPWMAALGMSLSSLLVVANAARLVRERGPGRAPEPLPETLQPKQGVEPEPKAEAGTP